MPQHLSGWRNVLYQTNGYETRYLLARQGGRIAGVLPLFIVRSFLMGNTAMTMPGGLCADSEEIAGALIERGWETARQAGARNLVLHDTRRAWEGDLHTTSRHVHWVVDVRLSPEEMWHKLDGNIRRQVRIAHRNELSVCIDRTGALLGPFYDVLSRFTHEAGTPVFGRNFLEQVIDTFPNSFNIAVVYKEQQPVGAYFQLELGRTVYGVWGATLRDYLQLRPTYLVYWKMLSDASTNGFHFLDMGRSPANSNASAFKGQWGGVARPVYQQVAGLQAGPATSMAGRAAADARFQLVRRLWPKLPLPVAQYLGPKLRRQVPFA